MGNGARDARRRQHTLPRCPPPAVRRACPRPRPPPLPLVTAAARAITAWVGGGQRGVVWGGGTGPPADAIDGGGGWAGATVCGRARTSCMQSSMQFSQRASKQAGRQSLPRGRAVCWSACVGGRVKMRRVGNAGGEWRQPGALPTPPRSDVSHAGERVAPCLPPCTAPPGGGGGGGRGSLGAARRRARFKRGARGCPPTTHPHPLTPPLRAQRGLPALPPPPPTHLHSPQGGRDQRSRSQGGGPTAPTCPARTDPPAGGGWVGGGWGGAVGGSANEGRRAPPAHAPPPPAVHQPTHPPTHLPTHPPTQLNPPSAQARPHPGA